MAGQVTPENSIAGSAQPDDDTTVALCLSGGGLRATFFHLGVVRFLAETGWLPRVRYVYSVSGGSILAAHMALNWDSYLHPDSEFRRAANELVDCGQFDMRGRILRRAWLPGLTRTGLLARYCDRLYKGACLADLPRTPQFNFMATSLTTGHVCAFRRSACVGISLGAGGARRRGPLFRTHASSFPISQAVAASAAFPAFFPAVKFRCRQALNEDVLERPHLPEWLYLADGGIFDNLGLAQLRLLTDTRVLGEGDSDLVKDGTTTLPFSEPPKVSHLIVSDAGAPFAYRLESRFGLVQRVWRTTDIAMARIADSDLERIRKRLEILATKEVLHVPIQTVVNGGTFKAGSKYRAQAPDVQEQLQYVRTDLDRFEPYLIGSLVRHGHEVAADRILFHREDEWPSERERPDLPPSLSLEPWTPTEDAEQDRLVHLLRKDGKVRLLGSLLDRRDPLGSTLLILSVLGVVSVLFLLWTK